jgi:rhodanese-related sulfurtransferase
MKIKNLKKNDCHCCKGDIEIETTDLELNIADVYPLNAQLVDIRNQEDSCLESFLESQRPIVVFCHRGVRSKELVKKMRSLGHLQFYSLKGGACSL